MNLNWLANGIKLYRRHMEKGLKGTDMRVTLLKEAPPLFQIQWELGGRFKCQIEREREKGSVGRQMYTM